MFDPKLITAEYYHAAKNELFLIDREQERIFDRVDYLGRHRQLLEARTVWLKEVVAFYESLEKEEKTTHA